MLTQQAPTRVQITSGQRMNLLRDIQREMSPHDVVREDACHLGTGKCHFGLAAASGEVETKLSILIDSALHSASRSLVNDVHTYLYVQISCRLSTRPILHSYDPAIRPIRDTIAQRYARCSGVPDAHPNPWTRSLT